jgi:hypothetical protein
MCVVKTKKGKKKNVFFKNSHGIFEVGACNDYKVEDIVLDSVLDHMEDHIVELNLHTFLVNCDRENNFQQENDFHTSSLDLDNNYLDNVVENKDHVEDNDHDENTVDHNEMDNHDENIVDHVEDNDLHENNCKYYLDNDFLKLLVVHLLPLPLD